MNRDFENNNYEQDNTPEPVDYIENTEVDQTEYSIDDTSDNTTQEIFSTTEQPSVENFDTPVDDNQQQEHTPSYSTPDDQPVDQGYNNPSNTGYYGTYNSYNNGYNNYNGYSNANTPSDYNNYYGASNNGYPYNQEQAPYAQPYDGADNQYQSSPFHNSPNSPNPDFPVSTPPKLTKERKRKNHGMKIAAIALVCALAGGAVGGVSTYALIANTKSGGSSLNNPGTVQNVKIDDKYNSSVEAIAAKVLPSVVGIQATYRAASSGMFGGQSGGEATSEGSGIVYREDGYIITNYHVVEGASTNGTITVYLDETSEEGYTATVVGYDAGADLAVLKIDKTGLTPIEIADSDKINVGQLAVAVGNPGGLQFMGSVSQGIVSGLNRTITLESGVSMNLIQTDAAINPGNSGGALVDGTGKLIGVNSAKLASSGSSPTSGGTNYEGMGFAIPVNDVVEICDRLISNQGKKAAYMGITIDSRYTAEALEQMGYPTGVVLASVVEGGPAAAAGLQISDIITSIQGTPVVSYELLISELAKYSPGETIELEVYRLSQTKKIQLTLGETSEQS